MIAILFTAALAIFILWYLIIYFDEDIESEGWAFYREVEEDD